MGNFSSYDYNELNENNILIFRDGTDKQVLNFINTLDLNDEDVVEEVFHAGVVYGRLPLLKKMYHKLGNIVGALSAININNAFLEAAKNGDLEIVIWLNSITGGDIDRDTAVEAIQLTKNREIKDWINDRFKIYEFPYWAE